MKSFFVNLQEAFEKSEIIGRDRVAVSDVQILCLTQPSTQTSDCREWAIQQLQLLEGLRQGVHGAVPFEETHMHHYVFWSRVLPDGLAVCGGCCRCPIRLANRPPLPLERALSAFQVWLSARRTLSPIFASHRLSSLQAEKDSSCRRILHKFFPETCLFTDVFGLVEDEPGRAELLDPQQVTWKQTCYCETHKRQCPVVFPRDTLLCLGAPCVLFSKLLASKGFA